MIPEKYGLLKNEGHGANILYPAYVFPDAIVGERVVAHVMSTPRGPKAVRVERL
jgi:hypothetical protein